MKKERIAVLLLLVLAAVSLAAYQFLSPKPVEGAKEITVNVDHLAGEDTSFTFTTQAEYLRQALEEQELAAGEESEYGLWVQTVDGETAMTGIDSTPIEEGKKYGLVLTVGY